MKRHRCTIETFTKTTEPSEPWENDWDLDEDEAKYEPRHVQGVIDLSNIQYYFSIRDDRIAVIFKNGGVVYIVDEFEAFYREVERLG